MLTHLNPEALNPLQRFRQADRILKSTSRASNPAWYRKPAELDFQVHLRSDGVKFVGLAYDKTTGEWLNGPNFDDSLIGDPAKTLAFAEYLIALAKERGATSLGIVFYNAEDLSTAELKERRLSQEEFVSLRTRIATEPKAVLADGSAAVENRIWRLFPYHSLNAPSAGTAVSIGNRWLEVLEVFRQTGIEADFPVIVEGVSAPLIALMALPGLKKDAVNWPIVAMLPFSRFTVLAFFDASGDLMLLRTIQHRGQGGPSNLRMVLSTTLAALEMPEPEFFVLPTDPAPDRRLIEDLYSFAASGAGTGTPFSSRPAVQVKLPGNLPAEFVLLTSAPDVDAPLSESGTFKSLRQEGWGVQDLLPPSAEAVALYPTKAEMQLLRASRYFRYFLILAALAIVGFVASDLVHVISLPEWSYKDEDAANLKKRQATLALQKMSIDHWDNLLADRSRAWTAMELLPRLSPDPSMMLIKNFACSTSPISLNVKAGARCGFVREWKITGSAKQQAVEALTRDKIAGLFSELARDTGEASFRLDLPTRSLLVNVKNQENPTFQRKGVALGAGMTSDESFPYLFDLTITQRFEDADPLSLDTAKGP